MALTLHPLGNCDEDGWVGGWEGGREGVQYFFLAEGHPYICMCK